MRPLTLIRDRATVAGIPGGFSRVLNEPRPVEGGARLFATVGGEMTGSALGL